MVDMVNQLLQEVMVSQLLLVAMDSLLLLLQEDMDNKLPMVSNNQLMLLDSMGNNNMVNKHISNMDSKLRNKHTANSNNMPTQINQRDTVKVVNYHNHSKQVEVHIMELLLHHYLMDQQDRKIYLKK